MDFLEGVSNGHLGCGHSCFTERCPKGASLEAYCKREENVGIRNTRFENAMNPICTHLTCADKFIYNVCLCEREGNDGRSECTALFQVSHECFTATFVRL